MSNFRSSLRWTVAVVAAAFAFFTGISIYQRPSCEVLYNPRMVEGGCHGPICVRIFILEVGNTGWDEQESVSVVVSDRWLELAILEPAAAMFGKVSRPMQVDHGEGSSVWRLGRLDAGKRIDIKFTLAADTPANLPDWDQILKEVRPSTLELN